MPTIDDYNTLDTSDPLCRPLLRSKRLVSVTVYVDWSLSSHFLTQTVPSGSI